MRKTLVAFVILGFAGAVSAQQFPDSSPSNKNQAIGVAPEDPAREAALEHAALNMIHKDYAGAADIYKELLRENPNDGITWNRLGIAPRLLNECSGKGRK